MNPINSLTPEKHLLNGLNAQQLAAVTWPQKSALILAGAGSGKTRVLTTRILWLLVTGQLSPSNILAVTFTNKAAREMQGRIAEQSALNVQAMWVGTFHGTCHRLLRLHWREAGLPQAFQIMDQADQLSAIKRLLKSLELSEENYPPRELQRFINSHKEKGDRPTKVATNGVNQHFRQMLDLYSAYENQCRREGVVDFAELLLLSYELLMGNSALREHYQQRFNHILVDEFQDTNHLQYAWLRCLAGEKNIIFAVGDDDQSIYAFRGADVGNMQSLLRDYAISEPVRMEQNYRSAGNILSAANAVIQHNDNRLGKDLWTNASQGEKLRLYEANNDYEEAEFIVNEVRALHREGMALSNMAVLYRSNAQSRIFEHQLVSSGVAYRIYGGLRFFERQEIKHTLAYLRLIANQEDDNAFLRIINIPGRGIGMRTIEHLMQTAKESGISLWQSACSGSGGRGADKIAQFVLLLEKIRQHAQSLNLAETISMVLEDSGLRAMYEADKKEAEERLSNLDELINAALDFSAKDKSQTLLEFLASATLEAGDHQADSNTDCLQLMTVHAAKGLEFDAVFASGLEEGLFPHENSMSSNKELQEERRLMYVAITRAKKRLYLSCAQMRTLHGRRTFPIHSRFIDDIPEEIISRISAKVSAPHPSSAPWLYEKKAPSTAIVNSSYRIGQNVKHAKFGIGVIVNSKTNGDSAHLQINFAEYGMKWLDGNIAKLIKI